MTRRLGSLLLALAATVLLTVAVVPSAPGVQRTAQQTAIPVTGLPAPYSQWHVTVTPVKAGNNQVLHLNFDSKLFGRRMTNTVYLPDDYQGAKAATPVIYSLHGTVLSPIDNCALNPITSLDTVVRAVGCGGGYLQDQLYAIATQLHAMHFAVVSPDTDPTGSACQTCMWVNGRQDLVPNVPPLTARTLPADDFLHQELYPLAEKLFNLRTDRAGRGVLGFSAGGWSAALQAMIHPDQYSYLGYVSGGYDIKEPVLNTDIIEPAGYFRDQGYSTHLTDPVWWAQYNPRDIATNIRGADIAFLLTSGDGCLSPTDVATKYCQGRFSVLATPVGAVLETELGYNRTIAVDDLTAKGIPFTTVHTSGTHGANNADMFAQQIVPGANAKFAAGAKTPAVFGYRAALPDFRVWGYHVSVTRPFDGFVDLTGVRTDGRAMTVSGPGSVHVTTPPGAVTPGGTHRVLITHGGATRSQMVQAQSDGRVQFTVSSDATPTTITVD